MTTVIGLSAPGMPSGMPASIVGAHGTASARPLATASRDDTNRLGGTTQIDTKGTTRSAPFARQTNGPPGPIMSAMKRTHHPSSTPACRKGVHEMIATPILTTRLTPKALAR